MARDVPKLGPGRDHPQSRPQSQASPSLALHSCCPAEMFLPLVDTRWHHGGQKKLCCCHELRRKAGVHVLLVTCRVAAAAESSTQDRGKGEQALTPSSLHSPYTPHGPIAAVTLTCVLRDSSPQQRGQPLVQHDALGHREPGQGRDQGECWGAWGHGPHLEGGDDLLASVLEDVLIGPAGLRLGQLRGQVVVVPKPSDALGLQEAVLIPPGVPQVCKSHQGHQKETQLWVETWAAPAFVSCSPSKGFPCPWFKRTPAPCPFNLTIS